MKKTGFFQQKVRSNIKRKESIPHTKELPPPPFSTVTLRRRDSTTPNAVSIIYGELEHKVIDINRYFLFFFLFYNLGLLSVLDLNRGIISI